MGLFKNIFSGNNSDSASDVEDDAEAIYDAASIPIEGPPEFVKVGELQRQYWTYDPGEQAALQGRANAGLAWPELLRLHHLNCMEHVAAKEDRSATSAKCNASLALLLSPASPYRRRPALIWKTKDVPEPAPQSEHPEPDIQGYFSNVSITHLGCLEVIRLNDSRLPERIDFVSFDELAGVLLATPSLLRGARLMFDNGTSEIVILPLLYGMTWVVGSKEDRTARMTRFVAHLETKQGGIPGGAGIGVGHQDYCLQDRDDKVSLFGLASMHELFFPLDMRDQRFDEKARARGMDPDEIRKQLNNA